MASAQAPASLPPGWQGFWPLIARPVLGAMRDRGPLTFNEVVHIIRFQAIHADLVSGHNNGPDWGARNLAQVVLEDAAEIIVVTDDGRYTVPVDVTGYLSPWKQVTYKLLTIEEAAAAAAHAATERPVLHWVDRRMYDPHGGKWIDGRLPGRKYGPEDVAEMADVISSLGWQSGARIVKDQRGVTINGHLRVDALGTLGIDPDTGTDPTTGEPYVEIRSFDNDAARLLFALTANWSTLSAATRRAIGKQVLGGPPLTLEAVRTVLAPIAARMSLPINGGVPLPTPVDELAPDELAPPLEPPRRRTRVKTLTDDDLDLIAQVEARGHHGGTSKELSSHHGSVTGRLTRLRYAGKVVMLAERRDGANVYVIPDWVDDRAEAGWKGDGTSEPPAAPMDPMEYTNAEVASMPWRKACGEGFVSQHGKGRLWVAGMPSANAPVADHIEALIADLNAKVPFLLPMVCERLAGS